MFFRKKVGVDLGTVNTLVYVQKEGIVLNEPTVVAYSLEDKQILSVETMHGRCWVGPLGPL